ncbi:TfoX/Sxy family protein [soil metagenome]
MAHDEDLADRIRDLLAAEPELAEKRMFGGLAFLVEGKMALAASGQGGIMVRVDRGQAAHLVATTQAEHMVMRDREMRGWLRVPVEHLRTRRQLSTWVARGLAAARAAT